MTITPWIKHADACIGIGAAYAYHIVCLIGPSPAALWRGVLQYLKAEEASPLARSEASTGGGGPAEPLFPAEQGQLCQLGLNAGRRALIRAQLTHAAAAL